MAGEWPVERTAYPHPTLDPGLVRLVIIGLNLHAAKEVWEVATEESLAARALAGEDIED